MYLKFFHISYKIVSFQNVPDLNAIFVYISELF